MDTAKEADYLTVKEYLDGEQFSDVRHEYIDGHVYAMVGATRWHNLISGNVHTQMNIHLKGKPCKPCKPFISDMKVKVDNKFFYPDVLVDCSEGANGKSLFTENPVLIVEVLSEATKKMDRTTKFSAYKNIASLQEYVLIEQDFINVQVFRRSDNWHSQAYLAGEKIAFESIDLTLPIEEIYDSVGIEDEEVEDLE